MCAVDALAMAAMLDCVSRVDSCCAVSGRPVQVAMTGQAVTANHPTAPRVGIHWAPACGHTAHSLCRQMIFLADEEVAAGWRAEATEARRIYTLEQAAALGAAFFVPLLA